MKRRRDLIILPRLRALVVNPRVRRLVQLFLMLISVLTFGTAGYVGIEGWSIFDALYMTVITVASVGFQEVHPLSAEGRAFTIALIIAGFGTVAYGLSAITAFWVEGDLLNVWESGKMERRVAGLRDHIVVCGGGDTGRHIARELLATRTPFVVIEIDRGQEEHLKRLGPEVIYVFGDATDAETLRQAGVGAARGLLACLPSDKDNLFALLSARELNPKIRIVSRVVDEASRGKLLRAGADAVVSSTSRRAPAGLRDDPAHRGARAGRHAARSRGRARAGDRGGRGGGRAVAGSLEAPGAGRPDRVRLARGRQRSPPFQPAARAAAAGGRRADRLR
jgi:hypothetical protein